MELLSTALVCPPEEKRNSAPFPKPRPAKCLTCCSLRVTSLSGPPSAVAVFERVVRNQADDPDSSFSRVGELGVYMWVGQILTQQPGGAFKAVNLAQQQ